MSRLIPSLCAVAVFGTFVATGLAAEPTLAQEVHEMRRDLQLQSRQLETLTQQVAKLTQLLQEREPARATPESALPATAAGAPIPPTAKPPGEPEPEIPKAEAVSPMIQHVVEKGETLTSIAKRYNIPLADVQKLNKITNDRKLQIGQTLNIPAVKAPEAPPEKKENP